MRLPVAVPVLLLAVAVASAHAQDRTADAAHAEIDRRAAALADKLTAWRHDIHEHPELSYQETRTAALVADHLKSLGLEVRTGVGGHGVLAILHGGKPGPVVALRAEMDALPVTEQVDLPWKSTVRTTYNGVETGVMHACGHDEHVAMLMGAAEILTAMKAQIPGTIKFFFQPAEESPPVGGAQPMIDAGVMDNPKVGAVFGLHVGPGPLGNVSYNIGPTTAAADAFRIVVHGKQAHGAMPFAGIDPIVIGSQIVLGIQTIISRQVNLGSAPAVITVGAFNGGLRENIIPDSVWMIGTIRTYDEDVRSLIHERLTRTAEEIAKSGGATATVTITRGYDVTMNDTALTRRMLPTLARVAGAGKFTQGHPSTAGEDFSRYAQHAPGFFFSLSVTPPEIDWHTAASNHSPLFQADDRALPIGTRLMANVAFDYLHSFPVASPPTPATTSRQRSPSEPK
ncbi:MAG: amidohydrolase [Gemmatimonadaceae bacterium]